ncbi:MAG TPA: radical SAM protein [Spirochaetota bacterium]|nr:radical SAM protein [Spirochaetota bacterium]
MRVAIVIPPVRDLYFTPQRASFLGPHTLSSILGKHGVEHAIFNAVRGRGRPVPLPDELGYLAPYLCRRYFFTEYRRYGIEDDRMARIVADYRPDIILLSCFAFAYATDALSLSRALKKALPHATLIVGGAGVSAYPDYFLRNAPVDYAVRGEVGDSLVAIVRDPGAFTVDEGLVDAPGMKVSGRSFEPVIPVIVPIRESRDTIYYSTMLSRGCPNNCSFCSVKLTFPSYQRASLDDVDDLFTTVACSNKTAHVNFEDDNLGMDFDYLSRILDRLGSRTGGNFSFSMENGTDFHALDERKLAFLKRRNIRRLNVSFVSSNERVLAENGRRYSPRDFTGFVRSALSCSIPVTAYLIAGLPGEDYRSINEGIDFLAGLPVLIGISPFYPVPGISGFEEKNRFDKISPNLCKGTSFYPWNMCSTDELIHLFIRARESNLIKGTSIN